MQQVDGAIDMRKQGTPQGGVISPVLSNLFLHYVFDKWMQRNHLDVLWCRYADDGLLHCETLQQAETLLQKLRQRFNECGLELHPDKTKIVYCKDGKRKGNYPNKEFTFLGYTFRCRECKNSRTNELFESFTPAVGKAALKSMRAITRRSGVRWRTELSMYEIAKWFNPILQGWLNYYGRYSRSAMYPIARHFNLTLIAWAMKKYRHFRNKKTRAAIFVEKLARKQPDLFAHWRIGIFGSFV
jgi:RNA-directed DNA polymerase